MEVCSKAPTGWQCTRAAGHDGPCAAAPVELLGRYLDDQADLASAKFLKRACFVWWPLVFAMGVSIAFWAGRLLR